MTTSSIDHRPTPAAAPPFVPHERDPRAATAWLDLVRVVAILAVVLIHVLAPVVETKTTHFGSVTWWLADVVNSGVRWSVPVFVMVSGALLLDPTKTTAVAPFYARRLRRVGVPLAFWTVFYLCFRAVYNGSLTAEQAARDVFAGSPFLQLYFLFIVLGLYLLTPFLRVLIGAATQRMVVVFAVVMLCLGVADQALDMLGGAGDPNAITRFLPYVGYYVAGWVLRDLPITRRRVLTAAAVFVGAWAAIALGTGAVTDAVGWNRTAAYLYGFLSPPVVVMSLAGFVLLRAVGTGWRPALDCAARIRALAGLSFGVYLVHPAVLFPVRRVVGLPDDPAGMAGTAVVLLVVVTAASAAITALLQRLPLLRRTV
ncbi:MAG: acyltransferase [Nocardioidaceae bacterium]